MEHFWIHQLGLSFYWISVNNISPRLRLSNKSLINLHTYQYDFTFA